MATKEHSIANEDNHIRIVEEMINNDIKFDDVYIIGRIMKM